MIDDSLAATYLSLRTIGEHVLSAARHAATGRIGLAVVTGGIATPDFGQDDRVVAVIDGRLVVTDRGGRRDAPITTLRAAAEFAGVTAGAPTVYTPSTTCDLDAPLPIDHRAFVAISEWYSQVGDALVAFAGSLEGDEPVVPTLWPEHFDVAIRLDEVNYGGLAGDDFCAAPYAYVGPDAGLLPSSPAGFWTAPFGAVRTRDGVTSTADLAAFFAQGRIEAAGLQR